jgi:hypothetical protein
VVVPFLWATGSSPQLRYRILPLEHFSNIKVLKFRKESGMPTDNLIVHAGALHGSEKVSRQGRVPEAACGRGGASRQQKRPLGNAMPARSARDHRMFPLNTLMACS